MVAIEINLESLIAAHDDSALTAYRNALGALSTRGVNVKHKQDGFELSDTEAVLTVKYPTYIHLESAIRDAKMNVQKCMTECGIAEYVALVTGETDAEKTLAKQSSLTKKALQRYETICMFKHVIDNLRPAAVMEAKMAALKDHQIKHSEAITAGKDSTNDAAREPLLKSAIQHRDAFLQTLSSNDTLVYSGTAQSTCVVVSAPKVTEETRQRKAKREQVKERNAKVASKVLSKKKRQ